MVKNIIRLSQSDIGDQEKKAVLKVLDKGYLGMGEEVKQFEQLIKMAPIMMFSQKNNFIC